MSDQPRDDAVILVVAHEADRAWAEGTLLPRLERAGVKIRVANREPAPGKSRRKLLDERASRSRHTILVLTPAMVAGTRALIDEIVREHEHLVPLLLQPCEIPPPLRHLQYVDFTEGADPERAWRQLLDALGAPSEPQTPTHWRLAHPYAMPPDFTGRAAERATLTEWLTDDPAHPLLVLRALGGFGKTALAWHWLLRDVAPAEWPRVVWWSFYERDTADFERFVADALRYLAPERAGAGSPYEQAEALLAELRDRGALIVLDGFERALRAFARADAADADDAAAAAAEPRERDAVSPFADAFLRRVAALRGARARVLLTTSVRPAAVEGRGGALLPGCREEELLQLPPDDAVAFMRARGVRGTPAEIRAACEQLGYHPLSLRLLAGFIAGDARRPGDVAVAHDLRASGDLAQRQHRVLAEAYGALPPARQRLLGRLACFRGPVAYDTLAAVADTVPGGARDADLSDLVARGFVQHDQPTSRYDLPAIVRRFAYDRLSAEERTAIHAQLRDHFLALPVPPQPRTPDDLAPLVDAYHHTARAGRYDEALDLYRKRLAQAVYFQFGAYELQAELLRALFPDGEDRPPRLSDPGAQVWALNALANGYSLGGEPRRAVPLLGRANAIVERLGDWSNLSIGLANLGVLQTVVGALRGAHESLQRSLVASRDGADEVSQAVGLQALGRLQAYRGVWTDAEGALHHAIALFEKQSAVQGQGVAWADLALCALLRLRSGGGPGADAEAVTVRARRALELAEADARASFAVPRDYVRAHWLLGASHRAAGRPEEARRHLDEALARCRRATLLDQEADVLVELARLRLGAAATPDPAGVDEAEELAEEALLIAERGGYVLHGADARLVLAEVAARRGDAGAARAHAADARRLAACDGPPDYTYAAALHEGEALLARLAGPPPAPNEAVAAGDAAGAGPPDAGPLDAGQLDALVAADGKAGERVADLLARMALKDRSGLDLLTEPGVGAFLDALRRQQADTAPRLSEFVGRLMAETRHFEPHPLWLAWVVHVHARPLAGIGEELRRVAHRREEGGAAPYRSPRAEVRESPPRDLA